MKRINHLRQWRETVDDFKTLAAKVWTDGGGQHAAMAFVYPLEVDLPDDKSELMCAHPVLPVAGVSCEQWLAGVRQVARDRGGVQVLVIIDKVPVTTFPSAGVAAAAMRTRKHLELIGEAALPPVRHVLMLQVERVGEPLETWVATPTQAQAVEHVVATSWSLAAPHGAIEVVEGPVLGEWTSYKAADPAIGAFGRFLP